MGGCNVTLEVNPSRPLRGPCTVKDAGPEEWKPPTKGLTWFEPAVDWRPTAIPASLSVKGGVQ